MHRLATLFVETIILVSLTNGLVYYPHHWPYGSMVGELKEGLQASVTEKSSPTDEQWYTQQLDHFNPADTRTWQQRYFVNDQYWKKGGPVFIQIGGEGSVNRAWMTEGQWIKYA